MKPNPPGGGSSTTTISVPQGYELVNSSIESSCPGLDVLSYPSSNGTVTIKATAEDGAESGHCRVGIALTMKDAYERIITRSTSWGRRGGPGSGPFGPLVHMVPDRPIRPHASGGHPAEEGEMRRAKGALRFRDKANRTLLETALGS